LPAASITTMISSTVGGSAGYRRTLFLGTRPSPGIVIGDLR
jgi:hypothetical protein